MQTQTSLHVQTRLHEQPKSLTHVQVLATQEQVLPTQEQVLPTQEQVSLTQEQVLFTQVHCGPPVTQLQVHTAPGGIGVPHGTV
jgi:hypothetical protein